MNEYIQILGKLWILVVDCSQYQGIIDFDALEKDLYFGYWFGGHKIIILKSTEGNGFNDPVFQRNAKSAKDHGWLFVTYHFARPDYSPNDAKKECELAVASTINNGGSAVALDFEPGAIMPAQQLGEWRRDFCNHLNLVWAQAPHGLYTGAYLQGTDGRPIPLAGLDPNTIWLWVANYAQFGYTNDPDPRTLRSLAPMPPGFTKLAGQQYTSSAHLKGIGGTSVDMSIMTKEWAELFTGVPSPQQPVPVGGDDMSDEDVKTIIDTMNKNDEDTRAWMGPRAVMINGDGVQYKILETPEGYKKQWLPGGGPEGDLKGLLEDSRHLSAVGKPAGLDFVNITDPSKVLAFKNLPLVGPAPH